DQKQGKQHVAGDAPFGAAGLKLPKPTDTAKAEESGEDAPGNGKEIITQGDGVGPTRFDEQDEPKCQAEEGNNPALPPERTRPTQPLHPAAHPSTRVDKIREPPVQRHACPWAENTTIRPYYGRRW